MDVLPLCLVPINATIGHHGPSICSGHYITPINSRDTFYCNDSKITEFEMIDTQNASTEDVVMYNLIT